MSVAASGEETDLGNGTAGDPWRHINYAVNNINVVPGSVVCVQGGLYREVVQFSQSGTSQSTRITLAAHPGATTTVTLDGTVSEVVNGVLVDYIRHYVNDDDHNPCECRATIRIEDESHIRVSGITVTNRGNAGFVDCPAPYNLPQNCNAYGIGIRTLTPQSVVNDIVVDDCIVTGMKSAYPEALGVAISIGASEAGAKVQGLQVLDNRFEDADTRSELNLPGKAVKIVETGFIGVTGTLEDFLIAGNVFEDDSALGIDFAGNYGGPTTNEYTLNNHPRRGVISDNRFMTTGQSENYAIQVQASRQVLIERNYFYQAGRGIGVTTEPPCNIADFVISQYIWIRDNIFVYTQHADFIAGAFPGSDRCDDVSPALYPDYQSVSDVYFTNNTIYRGNTLLYANPSSILLPAINTSSFSSGLVGDSRFMNNIIYSDVNIFDVYVPGSSTPPVFDYNLLAATVTTPFKWNGYDLDWRGWRMFTGSGGDSHSYLLNTFYDAIFVGSTPDEGAFHLSGQNVSLSPPQLMLPGDAAAATPPVGAGILIGGEPTAWPAIYDFGLFTRPEFDYYGGVRDLDGRDIGADEYSLHSF